MILAEQKYKIEVVGSMLQSKIEIWNNFYFIFSRLKINIYKLKLNIFMIEIDYWYLHKWICNIPLNMSPKYNLLEKNIDITFLININNIN
jgi:hypothetical protein